MKITFVRSGGFAGPMMRVEGAVELNGDQGVVTSARRNYRRELSAEEARTLREGSLPEKKTGAAAPDAFQYNVTVTTADGKTQNATVQGDSSNPLIEWIRKESERIFSQK